MSTAVRDVVMIFRDAAGYQAQCRVHVSNSAAFNDLEAFAQGLAFRVQDVTGCKLIDLQIAYSIALPENVPEQPWEQSDVEKAGQITFQAESTALARLIIPGLGDEYVIANSKRIDLESIDIQAITDWVIDAYFSAYAVASDASDITTVKTGTQHFTRTRTSRNA